MAEVKFTQIATGDTGSDYELYALDTEGRIWTCDHSEEWRLYGAPEEPIPEPIGIKLGFRDGALRDISDEPDDKD